MQESRNCSVVSGAVDPSFSESESNCSQFMAKYIFLSRQQCSRICYALHHLNLLVGHFDNFLLLNMCAEQLE